MGFNQVFEKFQAEDPNEILDALKLVEQESTAAATEAAKARDAYFTDVNKKQAAVNDRISVLTGQSNELQKRIDDIRKSLVSATTSGDVKRLEGIKADMKALEADKLQVSDEIETLQTCRVTGDDRLYNNAVEKIDYFQQLRNSYIEAKVKVHTLAGEKVNVYKRVRDKINPQYGNGKGPDRTELDKHFHLEEYEKLEEKAAADKAEREAAEERESRVFTQVPEYFRKADPEQPQQEAICTKQSLRIAGTPKARNGRGI